MSGPRPAEIASPEVTKKAIFGLGCFWAPDGQFNGENGVLRTRVGYAGGTKPAPTYKNIMDHTEVIEVEYDPSLITYSALVDLFWHFHDPTIKMTMGKGSSTGRQYISLILYNDKSELEAIEKSCDAARKMFNRPIVTEMHQFDGHFYEAELYHQKYHLQCDTKIMSAFGLRPQDLVGSIVAAKLSAIVMGNGGRKPLEYLLQKTKLTDEQTKILEDLIASGGTGASCGI